MKCKICGALTKSKYQVCRRTLECRRLRGRLEYADHIEQRRAYARNYKSQFPEVRKNYRENNPEQSLLEDARTRAKKQGIPCTIVRDDIFIPSYCPILGIPLFRSKGKLTNNSPTLDKVIAERGYIPGNVCVISYKANRLKNNATLNEMEAIVAYMKGFL